MLDHELLGMLLAAGEVSQIRLRSPWTIHRAIEGLGRDVESQHLSRCFPSFERKPDAYVGSAVVGLVPAVHKLIAEGTLSLSGLGWDSAIVADRQRLRHYRRRLMGLDPPVADAIYRAATAWAAMSLTEEKNWDKAMESLERRRRSGTPKRRHGPVGVAL